jgi:hypothetical protein
VSQRNQKKDLGCAFETKGLGITFEKCGRCAWSILVTCRTSLDHFLVMIWLDVRGKWTEIFISEKLQVFRARWGGHEK